MTDAPLKQPWKPTNKAEESMHPSQRNSPPKRRMERAILAVNEGRMSQADSARYHGVSRQQLNRRISEAKKERLERDARSAVAVAAALDKPIRVENEARRVPPMEEFWQQYFSHTVCPDCDEAHPLPDFHRELMGLITDTETKNLLVQVPPFHSKSTLVTVWGTVYELVKNPNSINVIISKTTRLAERFVYQIARYLSEPRLYDGAPRNLIEDWGPFFDASSIWNAGQFYTIGRSSADKDPSVSAYGVGNQIYGIRATRMVFDDIVDLESSKSPERVADILRWCTQEAGTRGGMKSGRKIFVGTRVSAGDVYSYLDDLPGFKVFRYPCVMDEATQTTLWPEHFGWPQAEIMRETLAPDQWQLVYQCVDIPGMGASFPLDIVEQCYDMERSLGQYDPSWTLIAGLDPAGSGTKAGYTAMVLLGVDMVTGSWHIVDLVNVKSMKAPQMKDQIMDWAAAYPIRELRVEVNGLQGQLTQYNEEFRNGLAKHNVSIRPHITHRNKWDPEFGVESLAPRFYNRAISLPMGDLSSRARMRDFVDQLTQFPMGQVSDLVMAFWFASIGAREAWQQQKLPLFSDRRVPAHVAKRRRVVDFGEDRVLLPSQAMSRVGREMPFGGGTEMVKLTNMAGYISLPA